MNQTAARRNVLLVTSVLPWPLHRNGGAQRTELVRRALRDLGWTVTTLGVLPAGVAKVPDADELRAADVVEVVEVEEATHHPTGLAKFVPGPVRRAFVEAPSRYVSRYAADPVAADAVRRHAAAADLVVSRYLMPAAQSGLPTPDVPCILDFDDVDWQTLAERLRGEPWPGLGGKLAMRATLNALRQRTLPLARRFDARWCASQEDADDLRRDGFASTVLPNVPYDPAGGDLPEALPPADPSSHDVLFVGDLQHGPNKSGLERFLRHVWPRVVQTVTDARLRIVGRGMTEEQRSAWAMMPGVEPVGFAEDLREEYRRAAVAVVPSWWGGGTKIKVPEAAAMGRAVVATPAALRGFGKLAEGVTPPVVVADGDADFADAVEQLLLDVPRRDAAGAAGPALAAEHYSFAAVRRAVEQVVHKTVYR